MLSQAAFIRYIVFLHSCIADRAQAHIYMYVFILGIIAERGCMQTIYIVTIPNDMSCLS